MGKHLYLVTLTDGTHFSETYLQTISKMCTPRMNQDSSEFSLHFDPEVSKYCPSGEPCSMTKAKLPNHENQTMESFSQFLEGK